MKNETYYGVDYRLGNSWQPTSKRPKTFVEATNVLRDLVEAERSNPGGPLIKEFRIVQFTTQVNMEEIKRVEIE